MRTSIKLAIIFMLMGTTSVEARRQPRLRQADLLFHVAGQHNAITDVTPGMIDHVAIYLGGDSVVEAIGRGVVVTPIDSLCSRSDGYYVVGRVRHVARKQSVANALGFLGRHYDYLYLADNDDIYCSELVEFSFVDRKGRRLFAPIPMSFHDETGRITPYWTDFYQRHGMAVPEGQPGTNPGELSQRRQVSIISELSSARNRRH